MNRLSKLIGFSNLFNEEPFLVNIYNEESQNSEDEILLLVKSDLIVVMVCGATTNETGTLYIKGEYRRSDIDDKIKALKSGKVTVSDFLDQLPAKNKKSE